MAAPALSVLVLAHNYARYLPDCLDSILGQSFPSIEVIVLDDASTDETPAVVARYCSADPRVRSVRHTVNRGFAASLLEGTNVHSRGEFLMVISADDLAVEPRAFEGQVAALRVSPSAVACASAYVKLNAGTRELRRLPFAPGVVPGPVFVRRLLTDRECALLHSGTMVRAAAYHAAGGYDGRLRNYLDLAFFARVGVAGDVCYIGRPLYGYRIHPHQFSGGDGRRREMLREGIAVLHDAVTLARAHGVELRRSHVIRARVTDLALADAFANRRRVAALRCLDAVALAPREALVAPGLWLAVSRIVLGKHGWALLARLRGGLASARDRRERHLPAPRV